MRRRHACPRQIAGFPERRSYDLISLRAAMLSTVAQLRVRSLAAHQNMTYGSCDAADLTPSSLNFAVSDGRHLVVIRYRSSPVEGGVEAREYKVVRHKPAD